jgi:hypothetical protein
MYKKLALPILSGFLVVFLILSIFKANTADAQFHGSIHPAATFASLGTAFTYQGHLTYGGQPANGSYDFIFDLYDSEASGTGILLGSVSLEDQVVDNGMFIVVLDYGEVFDGTALWLEIHVRLGDSTGAFTVLAPRQSLTSAPYASFASKAGSVLWTGIAQIPTGFEDDVDDDTLAGLSCTSGQIPEWNGADWVCGMDDAGPGSSWSLTGNADTTAGTNFLGTTDNMALELHVNGVRALRLEPGASPNVIAGYSGNSAGASAEGATICGGGRDLAINQADGSYSTVAGGAGNTTGGYGSFLGGGEGSTANGSYSAVSGGQQNLTDGDYAAISGGQSNTAAGAYTSVGGGYGNLITDSNGTIAGGRNNAVFANDAAVGGGYYNRITGAYGTIAGGGPADLGNPTTSSNQVVDDYGTISGGGGNTAGSDDGNPSNASFTTIGGGQNNTVSATYATAGGGYSNTNGGYAATIAGGTNNTSISSYAVVAGGGSNTVSGTYASVVGGRSNIAGGAYASIGGGYGNQVTGNYGTVPGGVFNHVESNYGFAAGYQAQAEHQGSFVWSDSTDELTSTGSDQFLIDASGGVGIGTNSPTAQLTIEGGTLIRSRTPITVGLILSYSRRLQAPSALAAIGDMLYVTSYATNTLTIVDVTNPENPRPIGYTTSGLHGPGDIQIKGDLAYIASKLNDSLVVLDISDPANPDGLGSSNMNLDGPVALQVAGNHAYVASSGSGGGPDGLAVFEIADPQEVLSTGFISVTLDGTSDVYVAGDFAYVTSMNNDQLAVFDVSKPDSIAVKGAISDSLDAPVGVHVRDGYAYVIGKNSNNLVSFDVSDPDNITYVGQASAELTHPRSLYISGDYAYVAFAGDDTTNSSCGLAILDISDPADISILTQIDMSDWLMWVKKGTVEEPIWEQVPPKPVYVHGNGKRIYVANEQHNTVTIFEIDDLTTPAVTAGAVQAGSIEVTDNGRINNDLVVGGGLNVGRGGVFIEGQLAVSGSENNYILGALNIGPAGMVVTGAVDTEILYPTQQLEVHGDTRFHVNSEHSLIMSSLPQKGAFLDFTTNNYGSSYTPTARIEFFVPDPFTGTTHTTDIKFLTQSATDTQVRGRMSIGEEIYFFNVAPDLSLRTTMSLTKNGDVLPGVDNSYQLGDSNNRWAAVYAANGTIQTSDARWKENIANLQAGLEEIQQLRPISFRWKDAPDQGEHYGLIAQEVAEVLPELVSGMAAPESPLGMNYSELVPVLISAVQEQQKEINTQADQIVSLEARLAALEGSSRRNGWMTLNLNPLSWFVALGLAAGLAVSVHRTRRKERR